MTANAWCIWLGVSSVYLGSFLSGLRAEVPTGRLGDEEEVAAVIALLCSDLGANINGVTWDVDGGVLPTMY